MPLPHAEAQSAMKECMLLALLFVAPSLGSYSSTTRCYAEPNRHGEWYDFNEYTPNLAVLHFDNTIASIKQTGMWMYYDNVEYNTFSAGRVFWAGGIDLVTNVPAEYVDMASSLRYAGSPYSLNDASWTVYSGTGFTGHELFGTEDAPSLGHLGDDVSSIIIMGTSSWTFYDAPNYGGTNHVCLVPSLRFAHQDGRTLHVGLYPEPTTFHLTDNNIESVRKGCWSRNVVHANTTSSSPKHLSKHGAWGVIHTKP